MQKTEHNKNRTDKYVLAFQTDKSYGNGQTGRHTVVRHKCKQRTHTHTARVDKIKEGEGNAVSWYRRNWYMGWNNEVE